MILSKDRNEDLEDLYENAPCGYLSLARDGRVVKVNQTLCEWLGYPPAYLLGKRLRDLLNVAGKIFYETHFAPLLRMQGYFDEVALDFVTADDTILPVLANASERRDAQGNVRFTRVTVLRATQRRRYERQLVDAQEAARQAQKELEEINSALASGIEDRIAEIQAEKELGLLREQFIAVLGHDLRNPLTGVAAGVKMLTPMHEDEKSARILGLMGESIERMSGLVENLMDFARGRLGGGIGIEPTPPENLEPTLRHVIEELQSAHPARKIEVTIDLKEPLSVDHPRIAQMFSNLLANAISHGDASEPVAVCVSQSDARFAISVSNTGNPIAPETQARLFQPFQRGNQKRTTQGLGLGLYIADQIAAAHGGHIDVISTIERTVFTFVMPFGSKD